MHKSTRTKKEPPSLPHGLPAQNRIHNSPLSPPLYKPQEHTPCHKQKRLGRCTLTDKGNKKASGITPQEEYRTPHAQSLQEKRRNRQLRQITAKNEKSNRRRGNGTSIVTTTPIHTNQTPHWPELSSLSRCERYSWDCAQHGTNPLLEKNARTTKCSCITLQKQKNTRAQYGEGPQKNEKRKRMMPLRIISPLLQVARL